MISSREDKVFAFINSFILVAVACVSLIPLLSVVATSFSSRLPVERREVFLFPIDFTLDSWTYILSRSDLWNSFFISVLTTVAGTFLALLFTALIAYPLAKSRFPIGKILMFLIVLTMIFKAPVVPYFLVLKGIGLYDNLLVLILPQLLNAYNIAIMRSFMMQFPVEMEEAAAIDGCGAFRTLFQVVLPSSGAVLATLGLFYGVVLWNQFLHPIMFLQNVDLFPLQLKIRQLMTDGNQLPTLADLRDIKYNDDTLRSAIVTFAILPVLLVYPFLQKYFVKGAMLGSVKG